MDSDTLKIGGKPAFLPKGEDNIDAGKDMVDKMSDEVVAKGGKKM